VLDARRHDVRRVDLDVEQRRPQHEHVGRGDIDHLVAALALELVGEDLLELRTEALFHLLDVRVGDPARESRPAAVVVVLPVFLELHQRVEDGHTLVLRERRPRLHVDQAVLRALRQMQGVYQIGEV
jgi:hypothetical protein